MNKKKVNVKTKKNKAIKAKPKNKAKKVSKIVRKDFFLFPFTPKRIMSTLSQTQGWQIKELNVPDTWTVTKGQGIKVLVIDTGYTDHPDMGSGVLTSSCKSFVEGETAIEDKNGHSTHVCGIIGARDNDVGVVGVAPECEIITAKVLGSDGLGTFTGIRNALIYATQIKPHVINMSLGSHMDDDKIHELIKELHSMNIPIIAASGNDSAGNSVAYPGKYPEVICVTAFDKKGNAASFNSTGPETDFSAPGVDIYSTWLNHDYVQLSGTSMAAPFITGLVALLLAKHRDQELKTGANDCKTVEQIREHLIKYADDKGVVGMDDIWGYGVINTAKLIKTEGIDSDLPVSNPPEAPKKRKLHWVTRFWRKITSVFN